MTLDEFHALRAGDLISYKSPASINWGIGTVIRGTIAKQGDTRLMRTIRVTFRDGTSDHNITTMELFDSSATYLTKVQNSFLRGLTDEELAEWALAMGDNTEARLKLLDEMLKSAGEDGMSDVDQEITQHVRDAIAWMGAPRRKK